MRPFSLASMLSDSVLFPAVEAGLFAFVLWALIQQRRWDLENGGLVSIKRGDQSLNIFHGAYALLTGIFVLLATSAEPAKDHRVLFVLFNTSLIFYLCYLNRWFRNWLILRIIQIRRLDE